MQDDTDAVGPCRIIVSAKRSKAAQSVRLVRPFSYRDFKRVITKVVAGHAAAFAITTCPGGTGCIGRLLHRSLPLLARWPLCSRATPRRSGARPDKSRVGN